MKTTTPNGKGLPGSKITRQKYEWAILEILRITRKKPQTDTQLKKFMRSIKITTEIKKIMVDAKLIAPIKVNSMGKSSLWKLTQKGKAMQFDMQTLLDDYFVDRAIRHEGYRANRLARNGATEMPKQSRTPSPATSMATPPPVPPSTQLPLFCAPGDDTRLTWDEWITTAKAMGYEITKTVKL